MSVVAVRQGERAIKVKLLVAQKVQEILLVGVECSGALVGCIVDAVVNQRVETGRQNIGDDDVRRKKKSPACAFPL